MSTKVCIRPTNEDTVKCLFFPCSLGSEMIAIEELCEQINDTIGVLSKDYIWQRDEFKVYVPVTETDISPHISSTTCFGDNIEDEWFIVYIVFEISKQFKNLIIQIMDNDGDFLLIEAADYLEAWANPENTENRVFIYDSHIHIIPPQAVELGTKLELLTAINIIKETSESTKAPDSLEQAILCRIKDYPEKILTNIHRAVVELPLHVAALLILRPTLIAPIVDAYCNHDIIDAKCCKSIDFKDCVTINVKFTKLLYATLMHSQVISSVKHFASENIKKKNLGLKLTCGLQMIMKTNSSTDLFSSKEYHTFLNSLQQNGYFKNNIEGSKEYDRLLANAKEYFSIIECPISTNLSHSISELLKSDDYLKVKDSIIDQYFVRPEDEGDKEDWLIIKPDQLNEMLLERYGKTTNLKNDDVITSQSITSELSTFLKQTSDFEGIEPECTEKSEDDKIEFESDQFVSCIEKMLKILSTGEIQESKDGDEDFDEMQLSDTDDDDYETELSSKLLVSQNGHTNTLEDNKTLISNIVQSMKEEKASTGPMSNLLRTIGLHKSELLDSDDDID